MFATRKTCGSTALSLLAGLMGLGISGGCVGGKVTDAATGASMAGVTVEQVSGRCTAASHAPCASATQTTRTITWNGLTFAGVYLFDAYGEVNGEQNVQKLWAATGEQAIGLQYRREGYQPVSVWHLPNYSTIEDQGQSYFYTAVKTVPMCPLSAVDSDGDGLCDAAEKRLDTDPTSRDSDVDGVGDLVDAYGFSQVEYAACSDGVKNHAESDVDCGGRTCPSCANQKACTSAAHCSSGRCDRGVCRADLPWWTTYCQTPDCGIAQSVFKVCPANNPDCSPTRSTVLQPRIDGRFVSRIQTHVNIPNGYVLSRVSGPAEVGGTMVENYYGAFTVRSDVDLTFSYYHVAPNWGGTTNLDFVSSQFLSRDVITTVYRHPSFLTDGEPAELHARGVEIIAGESALTGIRPGQMRAYFLPTELCRGEGNFSNGALQITSNYSNPPYIANRGDVYRVSLPRFAHEYVHELFSEINTAYPGNHQCLNEGLADAISFAAGYLPEEDFGPKGQRGANFDEGCAEAMAKGEVHEVGNCPLWQVKRLGQLDEDFAYAMLHPQRTLSFDSCDLSSARTGNALLVLYSEAAGTDMSEAVQMAGIPNAGSYQAALTALGL